MKDKLKKLCDAIGVSGLENSVAKLAAQLLSPYVDTVSIDDFSNVIGYKKCGKPDAKTLLLDAHIDEVGMIVTHIEDGFVFVASCGGVDRRLLAAQEVVIHGKKDVVGIIGAKAPHLAKDKTVDKIEDIFIDTGYSNDELVQLISIGDRVTIQSSFYELLNDRVSVKSLDDRSAVACIIEAMRLINEYSLDYNIVVLFSSQEEVGSLGSKVAAYDITPDICIAVDVSFAYTSDAVAHKCGKMGDGVMIGVSTSLDAGMSDNLISLAKTHNIPYQIEVMGGKTGTNADGIALTKNGVKTALLSIPLRYMHTPIETVAIVDIIATTKLLALFMTGNNIEVSIANYTPIVENIIDNTDSSCESLFNSVLELCKIDGISGRETKVSDYILKQIEPYCEARIDNLGNIIAFKKGKNAADKRIMLAAHMDEVGLIVTGVTDDGMLKFDTVGGINMSVVLGRACRIDGKLYGVIGTKAVHQQSDDERDTVVCIDKLYIDIGALNKADALNMVSLGAGVAFIGDYKELGGNLIKAKAIDDRVGCAVLIELIRDELQTDCYFVFSTQEEIGLRGATVAAYSVEPDIAVVIETTAVADIYNVKGSKRVAKVGGGACISYMDNHTIYDKKMFDLAFELGQSNDIQCQTKSLISGGNDAGAIHRSKGGVRTLAISVPCRYIHSPSCVVSKNDVKAVLLLAKNIISSKNI